MCGIVGYVGNKSAKPILLEGLKKLEYRGYDSAGIALQVDQALDVIKKQGKLEKLEKALHNNKVESKIGIGHTRWATHGKPTDENSHPHYDADYNFAVVHNGIIENYQSIKEELLAEGKVFTSETDTEVIAHLVDKYYKGDLSEAVSRTVKRLEGSFAIAVISKNEEGRIVAVRKDSPLIVGLGQNENFLASDIPAFLNYTDQFYILEDGEMADIRKEEVKIYDYLTEKLVAKEIFEVNWDAEMAEKQGYQHFMLKEIKEQPESVKELFKNKINAEEIDLSQTGIDRSLFTDTHNIQIVACGTAYHSGLVAKYLFEELVEIPVQVDVASEYRYRKPLLDEKTLVIVVSQSGETADTLAALRLAQEKGARVLAFVNVQGSSIAREADHVIYLKAGPEIAVASTKAYTNMVAAFYLVSLQAAVWLNKIDEKRKQAYLKDLIRLPELIRQVISNVETQIKLIAKEYISHKNIFFIGRNLDYTIALEGALKLKEISYLHAEAYPAGELKHGTLALVDEGIPVIAVATRKDLFDKSYSNIKEVKSRGAEILLITWEGYLQENDTVDHLVELPDINDLFAGLLAIIPLQLLSYYTALYLDCDIDQPRNLAKSVTVE